MPNEIWLGPKTGLKYVFLLPNPPLLRDAPDHGWVETPNVAQLIEDNGNHWRKIVTIMAKLISTDEQDWRCYRDEHLFDQCALVFSLQQLKQIEGDKCTLFIVGNGFRQAMPISENAQTLGDKQLAYVNQDRTIWCPYLDYRQFPNALVSAIRLKL
ncbi:DUF6942 family protein [Marinomonas dokdonensis]|uniref:DUF6942 family protein n=1 Tax=Marinomonas dokdonensis TaxID=328224 RepID=UPI00405587FF